MNIQDRCIELFQKGETLTADEVADKIGESILAVRPSICVLYKEGYLVKTGDKRKNESGKYAHIWVKKASVKSTPIAPTPPVINEALEKAIRLVKQANKLGYSVADMTELFKDEVDTITLDSAVKVVFSS